MKKKRKKSGFTLIELLLSVALIAVIGAMGAPVYQAFQNKNDLHVATMVITQNLRRAQILSQASEGDSSWGVHIKSGLVTLFKGGDYNTRELDYDELSDISNSISISGDTEGVFSKQLGELNDDKSFPLTSLNKEEKTIQVNRKGMVEY